MEVDGRVQWKCTCRMEECNGSVQWKCACRMEESSGSAHVGLKSAVHVRMQSGDPSGPPYDSPHMLFLQLKSVIVNVCFWPL